MENLRLCYFIIYILPNIRFLYIDEIIVQAK